MDEFLCSKCGRTKPRSEFHEAKGSDRKRPVTSQCRRCRSRGYYRQRYPDSICAQCNEPRHLDVNGVCCDCNEESGLRQCRACGELLPLYLKFYGCRKTCKDCGAASRRSSRARR